jgi:3-deoxy-D-manno-octulosonic-acid transferase
VSVGEVRALRGLIERLSCEHPHWRLVISSTTDTGIAEARKLFSQAADLIRFPFDLSPSVHRLLDAVRPDVVALVELEVWPNLVRLCARRGVAVGVINGRLSRRSFAGYRRFRWAIGPTFGRLSFVGAQSPEYAQRFAELGVPQGRIEVTDSMKWDNARVQDPSEVPGVAALASALGIDRRRPLIVVGSTGASEEEALIAELPRLPRDAQMLLAPRKPERFEQVWRLVRQADPLAVRRRQSADGDHRVPAPKRRLFLLDSLGELQRAYALADVAWIGRTFVPGPQQGSDPAEPIALGKPTLIGPYHENFAQAVAVLEEAEGLIVTDRPGQVTAELLSDPQRMAELGRRGREAIERHQGATGRHIEMIERFMPQDEHARATDSPTDLR